MNSALPEQAVADRASQVTIVLPDGSRRTFEHAVTGTELAASIGPGLAKAAVAMEVDGALWDLSRKLPDGAAVRFVRFQDDEALPLIRHDAAHLMAEAVKELWPETQVTIGPAIEDGFYYDFARDEPFTPDDLEAIEARMREIVARDEPLEREEWERDKAVAFFEGLGERYKAELIAAIPEGEPITIYRQGDFVDLCRGPHMPSTGRMGAFKLMKVAGAYWRGDSRNPMLQRIYGTAWASQKQLDAYLHRLEEAERRDHRRLGRELGWFHFQEEAAGSAFWHPKGWMIYRTIESYLRRRLAAAGYHEIRTPQLIDRALWETSGHWEKFGEHMFTLESEHKTLRAQADELPGPRADLQPATAQLSRPAAAPGRVRLLPPQRAVGRAARPDAGARLHPGRRPHLLHPGADHRRDRGVLRAARQHLSRLRLRRVRRSSSPTGRRCGPAATRSGTRPRQRSGRRCGRPASRPRSTPARARSTVPSSNSACATRSAASGSAAPSRSTSCCPTGSAPAMSARTAASTPR